MMDEQPYTCVLVSDFNLQNFAGYIAADPEFPGVKPVTAPFGQPVASLLNRDLPCWQNTPDVAVIWTQPQSVVSAFKALLKYKPVPLQKMLQQVDEYCALLVNISERVKYAFVPSWVLPSYRSVFGVLDMRTEIGLTNTIMRMNLRLAENLEKASNIYALNTHRWIAPLALNYGIWGRSRSVTRSSRRPSGISKPPWGGCSDMHANSSSSIWTIRCGAASSVMPAGRISSWGDIITSGRPLRIFSTL
jgi:hypothetical protein